MHIILSNHFTHVGYGLYTSCQVHKVKQDNHAHPMYSYGATMHRTGCRKRTNPTTPDTGCSSCNLNPIISPQPICDAAVVPRPASQPRPSNVGDADREEGTDYDVNDADRDLLSLEGEADVGDAARI